MTVLIEARELVYVYPGGVRAVSGMNLRVCAGECYGLLGPNGAGKTTTLEMLEGILTPTAGTVRFRGQALDAAYHECIGIQFQATALQDFQTVRESLAMFARLYRHAGDLDELVALCDLGELLGRDTRRLSGGQRQRLLLAIALVNAPELVFLDEPTTGLDPQARRNFWSLIERVRGRGTTVLLTTHYMDEAERLCERIGIVDRGRIVAEGTPQALIREHFPARIIRLPRAAWPVGRALPDWVRASGGGLEIATDEVAPILARLESAGARLDDLRVVTPNLEDLFLKLTGHALRD